MPAAISSGPELLVEFVTSPFGSFTSSPVQSRTLNGFQLEVKKKKIDLKYMAIWFEFLFKCKISLRRLKCNSLTHRAICMRKTNNYVSSGFVALATVNWRVHGIRCHRTQRVCIICKAPTPSTVHTINSIHRVAPASYCPKYLVSRYGFRC